MGPAVLARVRQEDPSTYLRVAFNTTPKDVQLSIEQRSGPLDSIAPATAALWPVPGLNDMRLG